MKFIQRAMVHVRPTGFLMIAAILGLLGLAAPAHAETQTIATSATTAPDIGGSFTFFVAPQVNNSGTVVFGGNTTADFTGSLYAFDATSGLSLLQAGATGTFSLNNSGNVAFMLGNTIYTKTTAGPLNLIADSGVTAAPGGLNQVVGNFFSSTVALSDNGSVVFTSFWSEVGNPGNAGVGIFTGSGGALTAVARVGSPSPVGPNFSGVGNPSINATGEVAFTGTLPGDNVGVYLNTTTETRAVARDGDGAGELVGVLTNGTFLQPNFAKARDDGRVYFSTFIAGSDNNSFAGIYVGTGFAPPTALARVNEATPQLNELYSPGGGGLGGPIASPSGENVAFSAYTKNATTLAETGQGIFFSHNAPPHTVTHTGNSAPGGDGQFIALNTNAVSDNGIIFFSGYLGSTAGGASDGYALYLTNGNGVFADTVTVARRGDALDGSTISSITTPSPNIARVNNNGQVTYQADLADGRSGLFLFTPDLHWTASASGLWDDAPNWTLQINPAAVHNVYIDPASNQTVTGPTTPTTVKSLNVGGGIGDATLHLTSATGSLTVTNDLDVAAGSTVTQDAFTAALNVGGALNNDGHLDLGADVTVAGGLENHGSIDIVSHAHVTTTGGVTLHAGSTTAAAGHITGSVELLGSSVLTTVNSEAASFPGLPRLLTIDGNFGDLLRNNGTVHTEAGDTIIFNIDVKGAGDYTGSGTNIFNKTFSPGNSPAIVHFEGDVQLGSTATTVMEIGGAGPGDSDQLNIDGLLTLGGTLEIHFINFFSPALDDVFNLFTALGGITGAFDHIFIVQGEIQTDASSFFANGQFSLGGNFVPEPATLAVFVVAALILPRRRAAARA